jgi:hypothetical protein
MIRTKSAIPAAAILALALGIVCAPLLARKQSVDEKWQALNKELKQAYGQKDWPGAMSVVDRMLKLADETKNDEYRGSIWYTKACVHSLAGQKEEAIASIREALANGFTDYDRYRSDTDFDALRDNPEFKALLAEIKAKYGPAPLVWDRDTTAPQFPVQYDDPKDPRYAEMRREFAIDEVVAGAKDDYERLCRLARWVSTRWEHSPNQMASKSDPVTILREAKAGARFICREYAIVMAGVAAAYGMPARVINLLPRDVETRSEAHSVAEVWLDGLGKWVMDRPVVSSAGAGMLAEWKPFILRNAYYFKCGNDQRSFEHKTTAQLVLVPKDAPRPTKFAGGNEEVFAGAVYTSNPATFYAPPKR